MIIRTASGQVTPGDLFRVVATGYAIGVAAIFGLLFGVISLFVLFGAPIEGGRSFLLWPVLLPFIAVVQGVLVGVVVMLGLAIYRRYRPIEIDSTPGS